MSLMIYAVCIQFQHVVFSLNCQCFQFFLYTLCRSSLNVTHQGKTSFHLSFINMIIASQQMAFQFVVSVTAKSSFDVPEITRPIFSENMLYVQISYRQLVFQLLFCRLREWALVRVDHDYQYSHICTFLFENLQIVTRIFPEAQAFLRV